MVLFHQQITERYVDDIWPVIFPAAALVALGVAWLFVRRGEAFRAFLCSSATIGLLLISGGDRALPEPHHLDHRPRLQPDDLQRGRGRQHARGGADRRAHRDAVRAAVHDRRVLHLPGQDRRRIARLLGSRAAPRLAARPVGRPRPRTGCSPRPAPRLLGSGSPAGSLAASLVVVGGVPDRASVVARVFLGGATLAAVAPALVGHRRPGGRPRGRCWSASTCSRGRAARPAQGHAAGRPDGAPLRARPGLDGPASGAASWPAS